MAYNRDVFSSDICWYRFRGEPFSNGSGEVVQEMECMSFSVRVEENESTFFIYRRVHCMDKWLVSRVYYLV